MILKMIGAFFIIMSCVGFGLMVAAFYKNEVKALKSLIYALDFMECELQYRMPALPELCRRTANECDGGLRKIFINLSYELEDQISPDVKHCMDSVLSKVKDIPKEAQNCLYILGESLGRFDLQGQLKSLELVRKECRDRLKKLQGNSDVRLRTYRTLGLCGGAALIILLM